MVGVREGVVGGEHDVFEVGDMGLAECWVVGKLAEWGGDDGGVVEVDEVRVGEGLRRDVV